MKGGGLEVVSIEEEAFLVEKQFHLSQVFSSCCEVFQRPFDFFPVLN